MTDEERGKPLEPWRCPIGIPPESHGICSAGTCWWCLADRVKAQSDTEPVAWRWRWQSDPPNEWNFAAFAFYSKDAVIEPLYTAPPRPAALEEAKRYDMRDWYDALERGRKNPI